MRVLVTRRTAQKLLQAAVALVLATVMFSGTVQAGRMYWYCTAMGSTLTHACCADRTHRAHLAGAEKQAAHGAELVAPECCQPRSVASLDACTPSTPSTPTLRGAHELLGQPVLALPVAAGVVAPTWRSWVPDAPSRVHIGPVKLRVHARLMIFQV